MKFLGTMTPELLDRVNDKGLLALDDEVRKKFNIPDDRYYSVLTWPDSLAGRVWLDENRFRAAPKKKISKSDQKAAN
jgi:hypothetical protein